MKRKLIGREEKIRTTFKNIIKTNISNNFEEKSSARARVIIIFLIFLKNAK